MPTLAQTSPPLPLTEKKDASLKLSKRLQQKRQDSQYNEVTFGLPRPRHPIRSGEEQCPTDRTLFLPFPLSLPSPLLFTHPLAGDL